MKQATTAPVPPALAAAHQAAPLMAQALRETGTAREPAPTAAARSVA